MHVRAGPRGTALVRIQKPSGDGNTRTPGTKRKARKLPNLFRSFLLQNIQTGSAVHPASYPMGAEFSGAYS